MFEDFHRNGKLVRGVNSSFIVLIPKKEDASSLSNFRPISLIGCVYKVLAKVLAIRLSRVMGKLISENQSAFVGKRFILDGVVILNEAIEEAKRRKLQRIFFKIDFAKAYDSVDWGFLDQMLEQFNFNTKWRTWISECVSTATVNVLVNGSPSGEFKLERGLRQGDPLSPFLYLLVAEGLSIMINKATTIGLLDVVEMGNDKVKVSHLQYADDTIFLSNANLRDVWAMKCILHNFEALSGLKVNFHKCSISGVNVDRGRLLDMATILGCEVGDIPFSYLGIQVGSSNNKRALVNSLVEKIRRRIKSWEDRKLSFGGRVTLVKVVLSSIPTYYLSYFLLPSKTLNSIISLQRNFLWGGDSSTKKIAWIAWDLICNSKKIDGLGVKNLNLFNKALVGKWLWRFLTSKESLWVKVITSIHGSLEHSRVGLQQTRRGAGRSSWWSDVTKNGGADSTGWFWSSIERKIGDGGDTKFWEEVWVGDSTLKDRYPRLFSLSLSKDCYIKDMGSWSNGIWEWKWNWRREPFGREIDCFNALSSLLNRFSPKEGVKDEWSWKGNTTGRYTTKDAYALLCQLDNNGRNNSPAGEEFQILWKNFAPPKAVATAWRAILNRLPTRKNLQKRRVIMSVEELSCPLCNEKEETGAHLFTECRLTLPVWFSIYNWLKVTVVLHKFLKVHLLHNLGILQGIVGKKFATSIWICVVWILWKWRNMVVFENTQWDGEKIVDEIKSRLWSWGRTSKVFTCLLPFKDWQSDPRNFFCHL